MKDLTPTQFAWGTLFIILMAGTWLTATIIRLEGFKAPAATVMFMMVFVAVLYGWLISSIQRVTRK